MTREPTSWLQRRREEGETSAAMVESKTTGDHLVSSRCALQDNKRQRCFCCCCAARAGNKGPPAHDMQRSTAKATTKEEQSPMVAGGGRGGGGRGDTPGLVHNLGVAIAAAAEHLGRRAGWKRGWGGGCGGSVVTQPSRPGSAPPLPSREWKRLPHHHPPRPPSSAAQSPALPAQAGLGGGAPSDPQDGVGGRLSAGLPQICFPPSPTLSVIEFGAWRAQDTPSRASVV
jgi:hypothetical protein